MSRLSPKVAVPFWISTSNEWEFLLFIFISFLYFQLCWILAILIWYIIVLIWKFLMTYDVEHLSIFICLFATCLSSLVRFLLRSFVHLCIRLLVFSLLPFFVYCGDKFFISCEFCKHFLPVLENIGLSFCSLDSVFHRAVIFNFKQEQNCFLLSRSCFDVTSKNSSTNLRSCRFSSKKIYHLLEMLQVCVLSLGLWHILS